MAAAAIGLSAIFLVGGRGLQDADVNGYRLQIIVSSSTKYLKDSEKFKKQYSSFGSA
jgi:hypothetical protein